MLNGRLAASLSSREETLSRIEAALARTGSLGTVSVLPDYFVDRFVRLSDFDGLARAINKKGEEGGGGSIRGIKQAEVKGGNAVNVAYSLGTFGFSVNLITIANSLAAEALRATFKKFVNVNLAIVEGDPGYTVALEFLKNGKIVNVMVSDAGGLKDFDQGKLDESHWKMLDNSDLVCLLNWSAIGKNATALTEAVFSRAKESGRKSTFFDPADVLEKSEDLPELKKKVLDRGLIDFFSLNDNEARIMSRVLANHRLPQDYGHDDLEKTARVLADMTGGRVDIHAQRFSTSCRSTEVFTMDCHILEQKTITGAGDVWDSADIIGYRAGLEDSERLTLANAAAGLYISREEATPPDGNEVLRFLKGELAISE